MQRYGKADSEKLYRVGILIIIVIMRRIYYAIIAIVLVFFSSCAVFAPNGEYLSSIIYTDITKPGMVTSNVVGTKVGMASATNILGIVSMGDASVQKAAQEAGIKKISHVDVKNEGVLGVYSKTTTYVYGE